MKTITRIITLVLVLAMFACTATTAFAAYEESIHGCYSVDDGYVTLDTIIRDYSDDPDGYTYKGKKIVTVGDLFWTGTIGSAESSGSLAIASDTADCVTWTLKDGVCIIKGNPDKPAGIDAGIAHNSPFWNNEHIQTIIIDANVKGIGDNTFTFGLPNLKTVVILGNKSDVVLAGETSRLGKPTRGLFPSDHDINFVLEHSRTDANGYYNRHNDKMLISTSAHLDKWANGAAVEYDNRADYIAAAANILANAVMTDEAWATLPTDLAQAGLAAKNGGSLIGQNTPKTTMSSWAAEEVGKVFAIGIGKSTWTGKNLTVAITRGQFAQLAVETYVAITGNMPSYSNNPFTDVANSDTAILQAVSLGIINGYGNGQFGTNDLLTREQAATMLKRLADACGIELPTGSNPFSDNIADWALDGVTACNAAKIMSGYGNGLFGAKDNYTVEQSLLTMYRTYAYIVK